MPPHIEVQPRLTSQKSATGTDTNSGALRGGSGTTDEVPEYQVVEPARFEAVMPTRRNQPTSEVVGRYAERGPESSAVEPLAPTQSSGRVSESAPSVVQRSHSTL